jgi:hypothetical protein
MAKHSITNEVVCFDGPLEPFIKESTFKIITRWVIYIALGVLAVKMGLGDFLKMGKQ